jgi:hypothetical protein
MIRRFLPALAALSLLTATVAVAPATASAGPRSSPAISGISRICDDYEQKYCLGVDGTAGEIVVVIVQALMVLWNIITTSPPSDPNDETSEQNDGEDGDPPGKKEIGLYLTLNKHDVPSLGKCGRKGAALTVCRWILEGGPDGKGLMLANLYWYDKGKLRYLTIRAFKKGSGLELEPKLKGKAVHQQVFYFPDLSKG